MLPISLFAIFLHIFLYYKICLSMPVNTKINTLLRSIIHNTHNQTASHIILSFYHTSYDSNIHILTPTTKLYYLQYKIYTDLLELSRADYKYHQHRLYYTYSIYRNNDILLGLPSIHGHNILVIMSILSCLMFVQATLCEFNRFAYYILLVFVDWHHRKSYNNSMMYLLSMSLPHIIKIRS